MFSAGGDEQGRSVVSAASKARQGRGRRDSGQPVEAALKLGGLGTVAIDTTPEAAQSGFGGLGGIGEAVGVGPQPGPHRGIALKGATGVELLTQRDGRGD